MAYRDIQKTMRRVVHATMRVPAYYLATENGTPVPVDIRVRRETVRLGDQKGTNFNSAERVTVSPEIVFSTAQVPAPKRGAFVSVEPGEVYMLGSAQPSNGEFVTVEVARLSEARVVNFPVRDEYL